MWGAGVCPTGVAVGVGVCPTGVAVGAGVCPTGVSVGIGVATAVGGAVGAAVGGAVGAAVGPAVGEALAVDAAQLEKPTWFLSIVTAPFRARALPDTFAPVFNVMLVRARILPTNTVSVPMVAELTTRQNTLQPVLPLVIRTDELLAVVSVLPILKMKTAPESPWASRVSVPVN
jgi:hypothetical protein